MHYVVCRGRSVGLLVSNIEHAGTVDANRPRRDQAGDGQRSDYPRCRSCVKPVCSAGQDIENAVLVHGGTVEIVSRLRNGGAEHSWLYQRERTLADSLHQHRRQACRAIGQEQRVPPSARVRRLERDRDTACLTPQRSGAAHRTCLIREPIVHRRRRRNQAAESCQVKSRSKTLRGARGYAHLRRGEGQTGARGADCLGMSRYRRPQQKKCSKKPG